MLGSNFVQFLMLKSGVNIHSSKMFMSDDIMIVMNETENNNNNNNKKLLINSMHSSLLLESQTRNTNLVFFILEV